MGPVVSFTTVAAQLPAVSGKSWLELPGVSAIGFWFEHKTYSDSYTNYAVSVDQIESWTGFDFFVNLPDGVETAAEANTKWSTFQSF
ncbi:MAG: hypothetical protein E7115_01690 [Bacteroidales bacterium]|nr:hypothetical protein [Bacteroidales bacterium]